MLPILLLCLFFSFHTQAQQLHQPYDTNNPNLPNWVQLMYSPNADLTEVQQAFEAYYQNNPFEKNAHTQYYKRWQRHFARFPNWEAMNAEERRYYQQKQAEYVQKSLALRQQRSPSSVWQGIGPFDFDKTAASTSYACGAAHIYTVEKSASVPGLLYAGTATAGVWKSVDNGKNWSLTTSNIRMTAVRALEIDHQNPQIVFAASDLDGKVYQTLDGGLNWFVCGGTTFNSLQHEITDIVMHSTQNSILFLASSQGLYRSVNGGLSFTQIMSGIFQEIEVHPYLPNIIYAIKEDGNKTEFYKSVDHGLTFTHKPNGWPLPSSPFSDEQKRTEIAVTPADSNRIYALCAGTLGFGSGLYGMYVSNDAGENWSPICCGASMTNYPSLTNPNLLHWNDDGLGNGGQFYYDLALAVSSTNADSVLVGGVNLWVSGDGGNTFNCPAQWDHSYKNNYVHADIHDIHFLDDEIWIACDGGIFRSIDHGLNYTPRMEGIQGTDFWGFGAGFQDGEVMLGGTYHNGTLLKDNQVYTNDWLSTDGGDNYRGFVHPIHKRMTFSDYGKKILSGNRLLPNLTTPFNHAPHAGLTIGFSGSINFHPREYNTLYSTEYYQLWKSKDNGQNWEQVYDFTSGLITSLEIAWSNPDIMYMNYHQSNPNDDRFIFRSADGGQNWTNITPNTTLIPNDRWVTYDLTISATDPNKIWAARISKYEGTPNLDGHQVYESSDGGQTWQNITTSDLDGVYITNIEHHKGSQGGLYLGTRNAVYYKNDAMPNWALFNSGLPLRTYSVQLVPYYKGGKMRNGTNHSVYECDFYEDAPPVAQIAVHQSSSNCPRDTFYFASHAAARDNATYSWQFENGSPATSSAENPKVLFPSEGSYGVTLTVSDNFGNHTQALNNFITVSNDCEMDTLAGMALNLTNTTAYVLTEPVNQTFSEMTLSAWVRPNAIQNQYTGIITHAKDTFPAGLMLGSNNELMFQWPGAQWTWNSGLFVPVNEWSHVAVSISSDSATVYLNGIPSTYVANLGNLQWLEGIIIGRYADWFTRTFTGRIDEVCVWDRALTQDEIRARQHLTKYAQQEPNLIHYYQFNANTELVQDRVSVLHGAFYGAANRFTSTAPVGGGSSQKIIVNSSGFYNANQGFAHLQFPVTGTYPDGELVVNRLNVTPDQIVGSNLASAGYWIINNYGNNLTFSALDSLVLHSPSVIPFAPHNYRLYQRNTRAEGNTWTFGGILDSCDVVYGDHYMGFADGMNLTDFGQFMVASDSATIVSNTTIKNTVWPKDMVLYPNPIPNQQQLTVVTKTAASYQVLIVDLSGKQVFETTFSGTSAQIQLPDLAAGLYAVRVRSEFVIYNELLRIE